MLHLDSDVHRAAFYCVNIIQLLRFVTASVSLFSAGSETIKDEPSSGRPSTSVSETDVAAV